MANVSQLKFSGFECQDAGLVVNDKITKDQWIAAGEALGQVDAKLNWYIGDWLAACKGEAWGYGDLENVCQQFGLNYSTARHAVAICETFESGRRRPHLSFKHHQEVQGRDDADELLDWCEETTPPRSTRVLRDEKKRRNAESLADIILPDGQYNVIYADPPWQYNSGDQHSNETQETVLGTHYPSMPLDAICEMDVQSLSAANCALFLWCTSPTLEEAFEVVNSWGFDYKASMIWDKVLHNVGHYVSVRHELLLICTRGSMPHIEKLVDSVYEEERTKHSRKPKHFREVIEQMYPKAKRVELFAREKHDGWKVWGNDAAVV